MAVILALGGVLSLAIGALCVKEYLRTRQTLGLVKLVSPCTVAELADRLPGEVVELKGVVRCATPLTSEITGRPCVYYRSVTTREYVPASGDGKGSGLRQRRSEKISQNEQRIAFQLEDPTGQVTVNPFDAEIDARKLVDRFEPYAGVPTGSITVGGISIEFGGDSRTLGFRKVEHAVLVDQPVYVLGVLQDDGTIGPPPEGSRLRRFLISARSEEEIARDLWKKSYLLVASATVSFLVGAWMLSAAAVTTLASLF